MQFTGNQWTPGCTSPTLIECLFNLASSESSRIGGVRVPSGLRKRYVSADVLRSAVQGNPWLGALAANDVFCICRTIENRIQLGCAWLPPSLTTRSTTA